MPALALVAGQFATLQEVETYYSLTDVLDVLDAVEVMHPRERK
jgi:hypothetical protein